MNKEYEYSRFDFYLMRDGIESATVSIKQLQRIYLDTCKSFRKRFGTRHHPMRYAYIQSALSARHILRRLRDNTSNSCT